MNTNKSMFKRVASALGALALGAGIALTPATTVLAQGVPVDVTPDYTLEKPTFTRVSTDAGWRSEYHYAPQFQPVENQCANVGHGNWARVNCWTDDGDNLIVRVEFKYRRDIQGIYVKDDTAHKPTGGTVVRHSGRNKRFFPIPAENRTPDGKAYIIFNYENFEGQSFYIDASYNLASDWDTISVSVTQNVNRATDADPVVARQATVYESNFRKLSQPLQFEKIVEVDGKYKAVYSMINATEAEAGDVDMIQIWPVDKDTYTWRPEAEDGSWAPYVQTPTRPLGCNPANVDVPRLGYNGLGTDTGFINYTKDSADYPLIRDGAKTSIMVDIQPGWERLQYETWMTGCGNPFGRPGQMRPYQGQVTIPPFALAQVTKLVGGNLELQRVENGTTLGELDSAQEFGGTLTYPAGTLTMEHPDPS
ncbi:MAG: hypothetical protein SPG61_05455, partial [Arcanobacterium sp.]|nr:hypothetical protein [Arcanobacterium sp.]